MGKEGGVNKTVSTKAEIVLDGNILYIKTEAGVFNVNASEIRFGHLSIPPDFLRFLIAGNTKSIAWDLLRKVSVSEIFESEKESILHVAGYKGFDAAFSALNHIIADAPHGKPKLYYDIYETSSVIRRNVIITDGVFCACLHMWDREKGRKIKLRLPPNVYAEPAETYDVTVDQLEMALEDLESFFNFIKRLSQCKLIDSRRRRQCFDRYFIFRDRAMRELEEIEKENELEKVCSRIRTAGVVKISGGYLVFAGKSQYYFVQENGRVFEVVGNSNIMVRERVSKLYYGESSSEDWFKDVSSREELNDVARVIAKLRPDLAVVI